MIFLTLLATSALLRAEPVERFVPCAEILSPRSAATRPRTELVARLDGWSRAWPVYRNPDPRADLIILVAPDQERATLAHEFVRDSRLVGLFPGVNVTDDAKADWLVREELDEVADVITDTAEDRRRMLEIFAARPTCPVDHVDSITVVEDPGRAKADFWGPDPLSLVYVTEKTCVVRRRESSLLLGLRGTGPTLKEWLDGPLDVLARCDRGPGRATLSAAVRARVAAIYVVPEHTRQDTGRPQ